MCMGVEKVKEAKVQTLKGEFESLSMKDTDNIDEFCMKLSGILTNIRVLGESMEESSVVRKILRAVPEKFVQIASNIEQFGDVKTMSVEEVVGRLKAHEERVKGKSESSGAQLLLTQEEWSKKSNKSVGAYSGNQRGRGTYNYRGRGRNFSRGGNFGRGYQGRGEDRSRTFTPSRDNKDKSHIKCFNCNTYGHFAAECKKPSRRDKDKDKGQSHEANLAITNHDDEPTLLFTECKEKEAEVVLLNEESIRPSLVSSGHNDDSNLWYLDNGASNHMTGRKSKFTFLDESVTGVVKFGDGSSVRIEGKGSIMLHCKNGEERCLKNVYYIPTLKNNIISLGQLSESGHKVMLQGDYLWVNDERGELLMKVKRSPNRLYKILIDNVSSMCLLSKEEEVIKLWHMRLGHVNYQAMNMLSNEEMARGIPKFIKPKGICEGCLLSKQTQTPFPQQSKFAAKKKTGASACRFVWPYITSNSCG